MNREAPPPYFISLLRQFIKVLSAVIAPAALVAIVVSCNPELAHSEEPLTVNLGGVSHHTVSEDTNTWFHRAAVFQRGNWIGGYLRNSYGEDSFVAGYRVYHERKGAVTTEVLLSAVRGYDKCYGKFTQKERSLGKKKVNACFLPLITATIHTGTVIEPQISLWGDALVLTGKYSFNW